MKVSPLEQHIGYWMRFVSNHVSYAFARKLEAHGVTVAEWVLLRELLRLGATSPGILADFMGMTRGAVSKLIDRLVSKDLILRAVTSNDRRFQSVSLTPAGAALVPELASLADANDDEFFGHLTRKERQELLKILRALAAHHELKVPPTA